MSSSAVSTVRAAGARASAGAIRAGQQASGQLRPRLQVVGGLPQRVHRIPFLVSCITLLCVGLAALLGINIGLSRGAYEVFQLQKQQQQLTESTQNLNEQLAYVSSPGVVSARARALGMVPSGAPVFIQLSDGRILGDPKKAVAQPKAPHADLSTPSSANPRAAAARASRMQDAFTTQRAAERAAQGASGTIVDQPAPPADPSQGGNAPTQGAGTQNNGTQDSGTQNDGIQNSVGDGATPGN